jgi:prevent-host-death family protein
MVEVGIREFRSHMGAYMDRVKCGETIVLTERGKPVGRITPEPAELPKDATVEDKIWAMVRAGKASWNGKRFKASEVRVPLPPGVSLSDMILEDRQAGDDRLVPAKIQRDEHDALS